MIILKFFASLILFGMLCMLILFAISFFFASRFLDKFNQKFDADYSNKDNNEPLDIPTAIQCSKCGTFHAQMPVSRKCSCGHKL